MKYYPSEEVINRVLNLIRERKALLMQDIRDIVGNYFRTVKILDELEKKGEIKRVRAGNGRYIIVLHRSIVEWFK